MRQVQICHLIVFAAFLAGNSSIAGAQGCYYDAYDDYICETSQFTPKTGKAPATTGPSNPDYYLDEVRRTREAIDKLNEELRKSRSSGGSGDSCGVVIKGATDPSFANWQPGDDNTKRRIGDYLFHVSGEKSHSYNYDPGSDTHRFEVRSGDRFTSARYTDPPTSERSEIGQTPRLSLDKSRYASAQWSFMVEPGQTSTAPWLVLGQFHPGFKASPSVALELAGNKLVLAVRSDSSSQKLPIATLVRGEWNDIKIDVHFDASGNGYVKVCYNGEQVVNYTGKVGYSAQETNHWNMGIYRRASPETFAYNVSGFSIKYGSSPAAVGHGS